MNKGRSKIKNQMIEFTARTCKLAKLCKKIRECITCGKPTCDLNACGWGNPMTDIIIVGQSLHDECKQTKYAQIPFIGPMLVDSGDVLFDGILAAGITPFELYITNIIKCHPPHNRPNERVEEINCYNYFVREIEIIKPKFVIALGKQATNTIVDFANSKKMVSHHGLALTKIEFAYREDSAKFQASLRDRETFTTSLLSVRHPSYAMRMGKEPVKAWIETFSKLLKILLK